MKSKDYYSRYDHFLNIDLSKVGSFKEVKDWLKNSKIIVDVGCGVGHLTSFWGAIGIDIDPSGINIARKKFPESRFILGDAAKKMPFLKNSIDAIICYNVLEHMADQERENFFREAKRVLKKEGILIAGYIDEDFWFNRLLARMFKDYGINDSTHLVSWKLDDFRNEIQKHFRIISMKKTSPYGKLTFITKFLKGELLILAK